MDDLEKLTTLLKQPLSCSEESEWNEAVCKEGDPWALVSKQSQMLKTIRGDMNHIHQGIKRMEERLETADKDLLKRTLGITQEGVSRVFCEKMRPELLERFGMLENGLASLKEQSPFFKKTLKAYGLVVGVSLLSALVCTVSIHTLLPPKHRFSAYTTELLGYGHLLKEAWPHLTDKEKERLKSAGKKTGRKGRL